MPIVAQTNDGLSTANSYVTTAELSEYALQRGIVLASADLESLLFKSMDYIESKQYKGELFRADQSTAFPIYGIGIPRAIKQAQLMLAVQADSADLIPSVLPNGIKKEVVDVISVEYFEPVSNGLTVFTVIDDLLKPYLAGISVGVNFKVFRG